MVDFDLLVNAIDYLLKPINLVELRNAIDKAVENVKAESSPERIENLLKTIDSDKSDRIAISTNDGISFIFIRDIARLQGSGNYSTIVLKDKTTIIASKRLKHFEDLIPEDAF